MSATEVFAADLVAQHKDDIIRHKKMRHAGQYSDNLNTGDSTPLHNLVAPHIDSFNWIFEPGGGIAQAVQTLPTMRISAVPEGSTGVAGPASDVEFRVSAISVGKPTWTRGSEDSRMLPADSRQLGVTYDAPLNLTLQYRIGGANAAWTEMSRPSGRLPIMVRSSRCHLAGASRAEMVRAKEEAGEWGGYFIINGNERCVRLLIMPRRNHITTLIRSSFLSRGAEYTKFATSIRCVRRDHTAITISAHYLETGGVNVRFTARKQEFFVPAVLILKALTGATDREIFEKITFNDPTLAFENERTELMLRESKALGLRSQSEVLAYLGSHFRNLLRADRDVSDAAVGLQLLREYLFIHVQDFDAAATEEAVNQAKFDLLVLMIQRVLALVQDKITPDHVDALSSHEVLLPGHLYYLILKENVQDMLLALRSNITREFRLAPGRVALTDPNWWRKMSDRIPEIGRKLSYFITTGNLVSRSGLDLMQVSGYTIVAEKLNYYRYLSHFRSIHRGQFFTTMKTTAVRKLLPESWGFVCPIHTPDGSPCGLLNHLTAVCQILTHSSSIPAKDTVAALFALGLRDTFLPARASDIPVMLDGVLVGRVPQLEAGAFSARVRFLKVTNHPAFYKHLEIFTVTDFSDKMFPAVCLSTTASRFQRPVYYLPTGAVPKPVVEYIGAMEQLMMEIAVTPADFRLGQTTHQEINAASMLSVVASLTPFSDHNQSPRNMYQCQMGKQTMGTPFHSFPYRVDNKVFRIQNVQTPIVRNEGPYQKYLFDEYPMGCNAVVAVISYTGYDMEDAMIINKSAYERGFGHGSVYKYKVRTHTRIYHVLFR
jgi:DNA-directed RNA polymerase I subunit RPA2